MAVVGICPECLGDLDESHNLSEIGHTNIYECRDCGHPTLIEKLIQPISFIKPGECPVCLQPTLYLIQKDIEAISLSENGIPIQNNNLYHDSKIFCTNCKSEFDYDKNGFIYSPISNMANQNRINEKKNNLIEAAKNPFSL